MTFKPLPQIADIGFRSYPLLKGGILSDCWRQASVYRRVNWILIV